MMILLPASKSYDPIWKKVAIFIWKWLLWAVEAVPEAFADDLDGPYQRMLSLFLAFAVVCALFAPFVVMEAAMFPWWGGLLIDVGIYLLFGLIYLCIR